MNENTNKNYFFERDTNTTLRLKKIRNELPSFCNEFFIGIENRTSVLTRLNYAYDLRLFFNFLTNNNETNVKNFTLSSLQDVSATDIELFLEHLSLYYKDKEKITNSLIAKSRKLATLRTFFKYFYNKNKLTYDIATKVSMPKVQKKPILRLEVDEIVRFLDIVESGNSLSDKQKQFHNKTKKRDLAMLTLFLGTGIRISECVGLDINDIDFRNHSFKVTRKGGAKDILYFTDEIASPLKDYLQEREENQTLNINNALFLSLQNKRISVRTVQDLVKKYSQIVTPLKNITPHKLRSTFGTNLYRETQDIYVVAEVLGHQDINTTKKHYADISEEIKRNASKKIVLRDNKN